MQEAEYFNTEEKREKSEFTENETINNFEKAKSDAVSKQNKPPKAPTTNINTYVPTN